MRSIFFKSLVAAVILSAQAHAQKPFNYVGRRDAWTPEFEQAIQNARCSDRHRAALKALIENHRDYIRIEGTIKSNMDSWYHLEVNLLSDPRGTFKDLEFLNCFPKLPGLNLGLFAAKSLPPESYRALASLKSLTLLSLRQTNLTNLKALRSMISLTSLNLDRNLDLSDISDVIPLIFLESIGMHGNPKIRNAFGVNALSELGHIGITESDITDVSVFSNLPLLQGLHLSNNRIGNLEALVNLPSLWVMDLQHNCIRSIPDLKFPALTRLDLHANLIAEIPNNPSITSIKDLKLSDNPASPEIKEADPWIREFDPEVRFRQRREKCAVPPQR